MLEKFFSIILRLPPVYSTSKRLAYLKLNETLKTRERVTLLKTSSISNEDSKNTLGTVFLNNANSRYFSVDNLLLKLNFSRNHNFEVSNLKTVTYDSTIVSPKLSLSSGDYSSRLLLTATIATALFLLYFLDDKVNAEEKLSTEDQNLLKAAREGDLHKFKELLKKGANLEAKDSEGNTPLLLAALSGHLHIVKFLIEETKTNTLHRDNVGNTVFLCAAYNGSIKIMDYLLSKFVSQLDKNKTQMSALLCAAVNGKTEAVEWLIKTQHANTNQKDHNGNNAFLLSVYGGYLETMQWLIRNGYGKYDTEDSVRKTALMVACERGHNSIVKWLVSEYKDNKMLERKNAYGGINTGWRPLHYAAYSGHYEIVRFLVDSGADINAKTHTRWDAIGFSLFFKNNELEEATPLLVAASQGHLNIVRYFIEVKKVNKTVKTYNQWNTCLHLAAQNGHRQVVEWLILNKHADIENKNYNQKTPLTLAIESQQTGIVECLLEHNANIFSQDKHVTPERLAELIVEHWGSNKEILYFVTPERLAELIVKNWVNKGKAEEILNLIKAHELSSAIKKDDLEKVRILLKKYPNLSTIKDKKGNTLLHMAAQQGTVWVSYIDPNVKNEEGKTALHIALENDNKGFFNQLISANKDLDLNVKNSLGDTALHIACRKGIMAFVDRLLNEHTMTNVINNNKETPAYIAAREGHESVVKALWEKGDSASFKQKDTSGLTAVSIAAKKGHLPIIKFFKEANEELLRETDNKGNTLFHLAAEGGYKNVAEELLNFDRAYYLGKLNADGFSGLHLAVQQGRDEFLQNVFFNKKMDLNLPDSVAHRTPLHWAVKNGRVSTVQLLSSNKEVNLELRDKLDKTPLDYAREGNNSRITEILLRQADLRGRQGQQKLNRQFCQIKNLIFQGGGIKGVAYLGALDALVDKGIDLSKIERVAGTSAGAITALILGLGCDLSQIDEIFAEDFNKFLDKKQKNSRNVIPWEKAKEKIWQLLVSNQEASIFKDLELRSFLKNSYIYSGETFKVWVDNLIEKRLESLKIEQEKRKNLTFKELHDFKTAYGFKDIYIKGVNLSKGTAETFSWEDTPNVIISDAVRISMSIPFLFEPHKVYEKNKQGKRVLKSDDLYIDGGVLDNYPIKVFDSEKYLNKEIGSKMSSHFINPETIGFRLIPNYKNKITKSEKIDSTWKYAIQLAMIFYNTQEYIYSNFDRRNIQIDTMNIFPYEFDLENDKKELLRLKGKEAVEFHIRQFGGIRIDSQTPLQILVEAGLKEGEQFKLDSVESIFYLFSVIKDAEIEAIKKLNLNLNLSDDVEDTPLHLAARHGREDCLLRLIACHADPNIKNRKRQYPMDIALNERHLPVVLALIENNFFQCSDPKGVYAFIKNECRKYGNCSETILRIDNFVDFYKKKNVRFFNVHESFFLEKFGMFCTFRQCGEPKREYYDSEQGLNI